MGWITMSQRRAELISSINQHTYEKMELARQIREISSYSMAIGDGKITPEEITNISSNLFNDALSFMDASNLHAEDTALTRTDEYFELYEGLTAEQYYNSGMANQISLFFDADGNLNDEAMMEQYYQEALVEYAEQIVKPQLQELEIEYENRKTELDMLVEAEQAELEQLESGISNSIQQTAIKLV